MWSGSQGSKPARFGATGPTVSCHACAPAAFYCMCARARQSIMQSMLMQRNAVTIRGARPRRIWDADARDGGAHVGSYWSRGTQVGRACWREIRRKVCCRGARRSSGFESRALGRTVKRENIACIACSQTRSHKHATPPAAPLERAICGPCLSAKPNIACTTAI